MPTPNSDAGPPASFPPRRSRWVLWLVIAVCAAPIVASYVAYYVWRPDGQVNYGELLAPRLLPDVPLQAMDDKPFRFSDLQPQWILLVADRAQCDELCRSKLTYIRQVRLAQGRETERVERVWLVTDKGAPSPALLADHPGLRVVHASNSAALQALPAQTTPAAHIYVVDPLGHVMMRFPENPDPRRILKDLSRLLRHSKWK